MAVAGSWCPTTSTWVSIPRSSASAGIKERSRDLSRSSRLPRPFSSDFPAGATTWRRQTLPPRWSDE
jgi:hypothetical protein